MVTANGLRHLQAFKGLSHLILFSHQLKTDGAAHLKGISRLGGLFIKDGKLTEAEMKRLRAALPTFEIRVNRSSVGF
jgi:hypothetical protein